MCEEDLHTSRKCELLMLCHFFSLIVGERFVDRNLLFQRRGRAPDKSTAMR